MLPVTCSSAKAANGIPKSDLTDQLRSALFVYNLILVEASVYIFIII